MAAYREFAQVYDMLMDNIDYDKWGDYLVQKLKENQVEDGLVCELGCGTGAITERLAQAGYDMIGIDASIEMLGVAQEKQLERKQKKSGSPACDILYLNQDMRSFELYGTVRAVISVCDCLNYITDESELTGIFRLVNNYLDPGGIFLFDMSTKAKYEAIGSGTIAENRDTCSFIWENEYDRQTCCNEYLLTLFLQEGDLYRKYEEVHVQRAYPAERICRLLEEAGMEVSGVWEAFTDNEPRETSERLYFLAREKGKKR